MSELQKQDDDEIDLRELLASLLAGWKTVLVSVVLCTSLSVLYAVTSTPIFESKAVFELKTSSGGPRIPSEYAGIAAMAGVSLGEDGSKGIFDRLVGRDFILRLSSDLDLEADRFFNPTGPVSTLSVTGVKLALGLITEEDIRADAEGSVVATYLKAVKVSETKNGSIAVSVRHDDADRAALIANGIVARVVRELAEEEKREQREQLEYLSSQLADALAQMEATKKSVADFALANSLSSPSAFATRSELMFGLREDQRRAAEMLSAVEDLTATMNATEAPTAEDYEALRRRSAIVDDVDFRRLIGAPEALDAWSWPPRERLSDFKSTLRDRIARVERSIEELRQEAELYATSTEQLASLQREATIAEATYNVLIEQVKAQSLVTGYQGDVARFYQSATPPRTPETPKRALLAALGGLVGGFMGVAFVIATAVRHGRLYTPQAIKTAAGGGVSITAPASFGSDRQDTSAYSATQRREVDPDLLDLYIARSASTSAVTVVASTAPNLSPLGIALSIAHRRKLGGAKTAVLMIGTPSRGALTLDFRPTVDGFSRANLDGVPVISADDPNAFAQLVTATDILSSLSSGGPQLNDLIVAVGHSYAATVVRALSRHKPFVVALTRPGATRRRLLEAIRAVAIPDAIVSLSR